MDLVVLHTQRTIQGECRGVLLNLMFQYIYTMMLHHI